MRTCHRVRFEMSFKSRIQALKSCMHTSLCDNFLHWSDLYCCWPVFELAWVGKTAKRKRFSGRIHTFDGIIVQDHLDWGKIRCPGCCWMLVFCWCIQYVRPRITIKAREIAVWRPRICSLGWCFSFSKSCHRRLSQATGSRRLEMHQWAILML